MGVAGVQPACQDEAPVQPEGYLRGCRGLARGAALWYTVRRCSISRCPGVRPMLDRDAFLAWLRAQEPATKFPPADASECPIACFIHEQGLHGASVGTLHWHHEGMRCALPKWARTFINQFDLNTSDHTAQSAITIIEGLTDGQRGL